MHLAAQAVTVAVTMKEAADEVAEEKSAQRRGTMH